MLSLVSGTKEKEKETKQEEEEEEKEAGGSRLREFLLLDEDMKLFQRLEKIEAVLELLRQLASKEVPQDIETYLRSEENMESLYKCLVAAMGVQAIRNFRKRCIIKMN